MAVWNKIIPDLGKLNKNLRIYQDFRFKNAGLLNNCFRQEKFLDQIKK